MDMGPSGLTVAENLKRIREQQKLTYTEVSRKLDSVGRVISPLAVRRMEEGARRVDVDDLVALSVVLGVAPTTLLVPNSFTRNEFVDITGIVSIEAQELWAWVRADKKPNGTGTSAAMEWIEYVRLVSPHWRSQQVLEGMLQLNEIAQAELKAKQGDRSQLDALLAKHREADGDD